MLPSTTIIEGAVLGLSGNSQMSGVVLPKDLIVRTVSLRHIRDSTTVNAQNPLLFRHFMVFRY